MSTFTERLNAATDTTDPQAYIARVKAVVADELKEADPAVELTDTGYYANSAIPDFEAKWGSSKRTRPIFLRHGLADVVAGRDTSYLPSTDPAILTLDTVEPDSGLIRDAEEQSKLKPGALIAPGTSFNSAVLTAEVSENTSPLAHLVRSNFVRGARGLITTETLDDFVTPDSHTDVSASEANHLELLASHFDEQVAQRIKTLTEILSLARLTKEEFESLEDLGSLASGRLQHEELKWLLPTLLKLNHQSSEGFWKSFGSLLSFRDLERLSVPLQGLDLTDFINANQDQWTARRAYSGLLIEDLRDQLAENPTPDTPNGTAEMRDSWTFFGSRLCKQIPGETRRISVAWDGTKLKRAPSVSSKTWEQASRLLEDRTLLQVDLKGIQRSVSINAEQSSDIRRDVTDITNSVEDHYLVNSVSVALKNLDDENVRAEVDFGGSIISANADVKLSELVDTTVKIFADRISEQSAGH